MIKSLDPLALATLTQPILLCEFSKVHSAAEWLLGHPVYTHEFPALRHQLSAAVLAQYPGMPTQAPEDWRALADEVRARYGPTVEVRRGSSERTASPLDTLVQAVARARL